MTFKCQTDHSKQRFISESRYLRFSYFCVANDVTRVHARGDIKTLRSYNSRRKMDTYNSYKNWKIRQCIKLTFISLRRRQDDAMYFLHIFHIPLDTIYQFTDFLHLREKHTSKLAVDLKYVYIRNFSYFADFRYQYSHSRVLCKVYIS